MISERGQSLFEFALVLPVMLILVVGIIDTARALTVRFLLVAATANASQFVAACQDASLAGDIVAGTSSILSGAVVTCEIERDQAVLACEGVTPGLGDIIRIRAVQEFKTATPGIGGYDFPIRADAGAPVLANCEVPE
jgi:hypothetical protein